jgi:hypothetical protein
LTLPLIVLLYTKNKVVGNVVCAVLIVFGLGFTYLMSYNHDILAYIIPHFYPHGTAYLSDIDNYLTYTYF